MITTQVNTFVPRHHSAGLVDDVNWWRARSSFLSHDWWISVAEQSSAIQVLFRVIHSDPSFTRGEGTWDHHPGHWILWSMIYQFVPIITLVTGRAGCILLLLWLLTDPLALWSLCRSQTRATLPMMIYHNNSSMLFDVWLWAVFVIIVFFCFNCRHRPGRRMATGQCSATHN